MLENVRSPLPSQMLSNAVRHNVTGCFPDVTGMQKYIVLSCKRHENGGSKGTGSLTLRILNEEKERLMPKLKGRKRFTSLRNLL